MPAALLLLLVLAGCGPGQTRMPLSGTVTFQGQAVENGHVTFLTTTTPSAPAGGALIQQGKFSVPAEQGLEPGTYKVAVSWVKGAGTRTPEQIAAGASTPGQEQIPEKYNKETTLTIEVTSQGPNQFTLKLE